MTKLGILCAFGLVLTSSNAPAQVIDFGTGITNNVLLTNYTEDSFLITSAEMRIIDTISPNTGLVRSDTGNFLLSNFGSPITVVGNPGSTFSISRFSFAEASFTSATPGLLTIIGQMSGGGSIATAFNIDGIADGSGSLADFQTVNVFGGFTGLTSLTFSASTPFALDSINLNLTSAVPEPSSWLMLLLGFAALGFALRRHRASIQLAT